MTLRRLFVLASVLIGTMAAMPGHADALRVVNELRAGECKAKRSNPPPLKVNTQLRTAAKHFLAGEPLRDALRRADYRADQSAVIRVRGEGSDASLKKLLVKNNCDSIGDPGLAEVGIHSQSGQIVMIFAAPFAPPATTASRDVAAEVLRRVNAARSASRRCGAQRFKAVPPVKLNEVLSQAAMKHARDMAKHNHVEHEGTDGSSPGDRAARVGYVWTSVGENIAAGQLSAEEVVTGWLASPGHCSNIMDGDFTEMGVAYVVDRDSRNGIYWAQVFGRPR